MPVRARVAWVSVVLAVVAGGTGAGLGAEGRIPIHAPFDIVAPGRYVLTRGIAVGPGGSAIAVYATDVVLDLNGFSIDASGGIGIYVGTGSSVEILDGTIRGGQVGVDSWGSVRIILDDVHFEAQSEAAVRLASDSGRPELEARHSRFLNGADGITLVGTPPWFQWVYARIVVEDCDFWRLAAGIRTTSYTYLEPLRVTHSTFQDVVTGLRIDGSGSLAVDGNAFLLCRESAVFAAQGEGQITGNVVEDFNRGSVERRGGIEIMYAEAMCVTGNVITSGTNADGIRIGGNEYGAPVEIRENLIRAVDDGIHVPLGAPLILGNDIAENRGHGIVLEGNVLQADIRSNLIAGNAGYGISLVGGMAAIIRDNALLNNALGAISATPTVPARDADGNYAQ